MMAESRPATVAAADAVNAEAGILHGNSLKNPNPTHVYRIDGPQGLHKVGESAAGVRVRMADLENPARVFKTIQAHEGYQYTATLGVGKSTSNPCPESVPLI
jgi:hypothetical protein